MKVLIADDQQSVHTYLENAVNWASFGVASLLHASNGSQCLEMVEAERPALLILDIKMPVMDGMAVLKEVRAQGYGPRVLLLSAYSDFSYAQQAIGYGVESYLLKPIRSMEVSQELGRVCEKMEEDRQTAIKSLFAGVCSARDESLLAYTFLHRSVSGALVFCPDKPALEALLTSARAHPALFFSKISSNHLLVLAYAQHHAELESFASSLDKPGPSYRCGICAEQPVERLADLLHLVDECRLKMLSSYYALEQVAFREASVFGQIDNNVQRVMLDDILGAIAARESREAMQQTVRALFEYYRRQRVHPEKLGQSVYLMLHEIHEKSGENNAPNAWADVAQDVRQCLEECANIQALEVFFFEKLSNDFFTNAQCMLALEGELVERIRKYLMDNIGEQITLETLSRHFFMNKYDLCRRFKSGTGENLWPYLTRLRMEHAKNLLDNTSLRVYEIAESLGYNSPAYFSNAFKKYTGQSPQQYKDGE